MARAYVWFVPGEYAVYFEAHGNAEAWAHIQKHKKRWGQSYDWPQGSHDSIAATYGDDDWFSDYPRRRLGNPWPPGVVKQTPKGTLYAGLPNSPPLPYVGREKWTIIHTNGEKDWIEIDDSRPGYRMARNSKRQTFEEDLDTSNERRRNLARDGWQRARVK